MVENIESGSFVARKKHRDSSWDYICEWFSYNRPFVKEGPTFAQYRALVSLKQNRGFILPGQRYNWQRNKMDGNLFTWKSLPEIEQICKQFNVYPYDEW
jgi:hypothetical protein